MKKVVIVGAGLGGLSAAIRLRAAGFDVEILEKNARIGGKLNLVEAHGYRFDTGPSLLTMPQVLDDLFAVAGVERRARLDLRPLEPICRYAWADGARLDASANLASMVAEIERIAPQDVSGFFRFLSYGADLYAATADAFLFNDFRDLGALRANLTPRLIRQIPRLATLKTVNDRVSEFFSSLHLRQLFNRYATYNGSSPYQAQATFCLIPYVEMALGGWYVPGGMYRIAETLGDAARDLGVRIRTGTEVAEIEIAQGAVTGVRLATGERAAAAAVVANADALYAYKNLIGSEHRKIYTDKRVDRIEPSSSGFVLLLGVRKKFDCLSHHNIFFSRDYADEFDALFKRLAPPDDPTIYVCASSRSDDSQAPPGCENLFVMVNAPCTRPDFDWTAVQEKYRNFIIRRLEEFGLSGLNNAIEYEQILTPTRFESWFNAHRGAIYGLSSNSLSSAFLRPPIRARDVAGLYFVGGSAHPGGGIPLVILSGKIAAQTIVRDDGRR